MNVNFVFGIDIGKRKLANALTLTDIDTHQQVSLAGCKSSLV